MASKKILGDFASGLDALKSFQGRMRIKADAARDRARDSTVRLDRAFDHTEFAIDELEREVSEIEAQLQHTNERPTE